MTLQEQLAVTKESLAACEAWVHEDIMWLMGWADLMIELQMLDDQVNSPEL